MKNLFLTHSINLITKYNSDYNEEKTEKLKYGLEGIYLTITKSIIILLISMLLNITKEFFIILVLVNVIRFFAFGFHAKTNKECLFVSCLLYIGIPLIIFHTNPNTLTQGIGSIICTLLIMTFAPADTIKRPLPNKKKRLIRKIASTAIATIYTLITFTTASSISQLFFCALIIQMINVNPIIYILFKQPYNNYRKYTSS